MLVKKAYLQIFPMWIKKALRYNSGDKRNKT